MHDFPFSSRITIADGASTDDILRIAVELAGDLPRVRLLRINQNGRGRALATAWLTGDARVVAQMDGQAPEPSGLVPTVAPIISARTHLSIARRFGGAIRALRSTLPADCCRQSGIEIGSSTWSC